MIITFDGARYMLQYGFYAVERSRGPELDYDYDYEHEFHSLCAAYGGRVPCGQLNVTVFQLSYTQLFANIYLQRMPQGLLDAMNHIQSESLAIFPGC
jgi:hypothetical protein